MRVDLELMTVAELAELLRLDRRSVYSLLKTNQIPGAKQLGGAWRISRTEVLAWFGKGTMPSSEGTR